jgi:hypothetical protein
MIREWNNHPLVVAGLLIVAALVWGTFLLQVQAEKGTHLLSTEPPNTGQIRAAVSLEIPYPATVRDPFAPFDEGASEDEPKEALTEHRPTPIRHRLHGIIGGSAIVLDQAGTSHIVRAGDQVDDIEIAAVNSDHVVVRRNGHSAHLTLNQ